MTRSALIEVAVLYLPIVGAIGCWVHFRPVARLTGPLLLSFLWNLIAIFALNQVAFYFDWWHYASNALSYHGLPLSVWFGWAIGWGLAAPLIPIKDARVLTLGCLILDLSLMPVLAPLVVLGKGWVVGEFIALGLVFMPGIAAYRWTLKQRALPFRVGIQALIFFSLVGYFLPDLILTHLEKRPYPIPTLSGAMGIIQFNSLIVWIVLGIASVREFMKQGKGTPIPYDPPKQIVSHGPYAYLSNPMQLATVGGLISYGWILQSWGIAAAGCMVIIYAAGVALPSEADDLSKRFSNDWKAYKGNFLPFIPRWTPIEHRTAATIYFDQQCSTCSYVQRWLESKHPTQLRFLPAKDYSGPPLNRLKYVDGSFEYDGVEAFARGLYHLHLGWATIAAFIEFPPMTKALQMIAEAEGFGKISRTRTVQESSVKMPTEKSSPGAFHYPEN